VIGVIIGSVGGLYVVGKHYAAAYALNKSTVAFQNEGIPASEIEAERAFNLYQSDVYMRRIGELQFGRINTLLNLPSPTDAERAEFENAIVRGIGAAEQARNLDAQDPENWALLGNIYSVLIGANIEGVYESAKSALTRSRELNPKNPLIVLNLAVLEGRSGNYDAARTYTNEAIALKPNFTDAFYYLSQIDILTGNVNAFHHHSRATESSTLLPARRT
jgi:tetratricopeptide (TPR) repeat protein